MTDNVNSMPEKIIIESKVISEQNEANPDELSLSQELLEESEVENKSFKKIDMSGLKKNDPDKNISKSQQDFKLKRYLPTNPKTKLYI